MLANRNLKYEKWMSIIIDIFFSRKAIQDDKISLYNSLSLLILVIKNQGNLKYLVCNKLKKLITNYMSKFSICKSSNLNNSVLFKSS